MSTKYFFNNREISIPGAYQQIKSGIKNPAIALAFGNTLIIDTGSGKFFGGGSGIDGVIKSGKDAHYTFDNVIDFRKFVRGGLHWSLAQYLFLPGGGAAAGISSLTYLRAAQTIPAEIALLFGDADSDSTNNGDLTLQVRDEGYIGNGVLGDEVRAKSTITVTNAGSAGNQISVIYSGDTLATYVVQSGDTIPDVVDGLAASLASIGLSDLFSKTNSQFVLYAPRGYANAINGHAPTVNVSGTVNGAAGNFTGGVEGTLLTRGYAAKIKAGVVDTDKFIVQFWRGTFKGLDTAVSNGKPFDNINELSTSAELLVTSPEVDNISDLIDWMKDESGIGFLFNQYFKLKTYDIANVDVILTSDITTGYVKASGGSEVFNIDHLNDALQSLEGLVFDFILSDKWGVNARSLENLTIADWITTTTKIQPDFYIAGGKDIGTWNTGVTSSNALAIAYNTQYVSLPHGGIALTDVGGRTLKEYDSIYKAAFLLGREAGIQPQNPLTFKGIGIQGELHNLYDKDVKLGLNNGVLMTRVDNGAYEVVKGINTLQNNTYLVNPDGTTHSKQLARIARQLNKLITINSKQELLKKPDGANRNTLSPEDVKTWVEGLLSKQIARPGEDGLIISFQNVEVSINGDAYEITYAFEPNFEVSFLFFTATIIDPNSK